MVLLILIGFVAGVITAISPCVLPVLPIVLAGGASGRKPVRIVVGLVASFSVFTLFATWLLDKLHLPQDFLRNAAIVLLFVMAATLLVPQAGQLIERPLAAFSRLRPSRVGGGFFLGVVLGLVFVPCAGPVLATVTVVAANQNVGLRAILLTLAYATGAAVPLLAIAFGGRAASSRVRAHAQQVRLVSGALIALVAIGLVFHLDDNLARFTPSYTSFLQNKVEDSHSARTQLAKVRGGRAPLAAKQPAKVGGLPDFGLAPALHADGAFINSKPFTLSQERGKVVLIDFWTYSCINCLRTLPHLKAWYAAYHSKGLVIVGVHTPEFAFEHVTSNVRAAVKRLGITYPVMQDNDFKTWDNYSNEYWPAEFLIDRQGHLRHTHDGEGDYALTENLIRKLLGTGGAMAKPVADATPDEAMTPETYLGYERIENYVGTTIAPGHFHAYRYPKSLGDSEIAYGGTWKIGAQEVVPGAGASLRLHFHAKDVYIVLGGQGTVQKLIDGKPAGTLKVDAYRLYTVRASNKVADATLELRFSPGVRGYSFTFG